MARRPQLRKWAVDIVGVATALAVLFGVLAVHALPALPPRWLDGLLATLALAAGLCPRLRLAACVLIGFAWYAVRADIALEARLPRALEGRDFVVIGVVDRLPVRRMDATSFSLRVERATLDGVVLPLHGRVRLSWYEDVPAALAACGRWQLRVRLKRPRGLINGGGFDSQRSALERGVVAVGYVRDADANRNPGEQLLCVNRLRDEISRGIAARVADPHDAALLQAFLVGAFAAIVRTHEHALLFDAGARYPSEFDLGEAAVLPTLHALGIGKLDMMMISHGDNDHAGGAPAVAKAYPGAVRFSVLNPAPGSLEGPAAPHNDNDRFRVLLVGGVAGRLLLTGDINKVVGGRRRCGGALNRWCWWYRITAARPRRARRSSPRCIRCSRWFAPVGAAASITPVRRWSSVTLPPACRCRIRPLRPHGRSIFLPTCHRGWCRKGASASGATGANSGIEVCNAVHRRQRRRCYDSRSSKLL